MEQTTAPGAAAPVNSAFKAILWGGLLCGILDMTSALVPYGMCGVPLIRIPQSIAGGLLGSATFQGGVQTAVLGTALHFVIAFGAATTYYLVSRKLSFLREHPVAAGLLYGEAVFLFMHFVVIPLSAIQPRPWTWTVPSLVAGPLGHPFVVGLPIALAVWRFAPKA